MARNTPPQRKKPIILIAFFITALLAILYLNRNSWLPSEPPGPGNEEGRSAMAPPEPAPVAQLPAAALEQAEQPATAATTSQPLSVVPGSETEQCRQLDESIGQFFNHLEKQEYIAAYGLKTGARSHLTGLLDKLLAQPPIVARETDDLSAILKNMAHFYRIIGPRNIFLVKDVLAAEKERIEPAMAAFYQWSELDQPCRGQAVDLNLPLPGLYEYAGFFLNTLGGQSYLFRREPSLRLLIKYYAVLILDRANMADMNGHGIDIRLPLDSLLAEMEATTLLAGKEDYLQRLVELQARYQLY